jgi:hypothetical protein
MAERQLPASPEGLNGPGKALWEAIVADVAEGWELDRREEHLLMRACRCEDELVEIETTVNRDGVTVAGSRGQTIVHPAITEARQLPDAVQAPRRARASDPRDARGTSTPAQARARRAAATRWGLAHG